MSAHPVIIIGSGLAGYNLAKELRKLAPETAITLVCADDGRFYSKPLLSNALAKQKSADALCMQTASQLSAQLNIKIITHTQVTAIDRQRQCILTQQGEFHYAKLVLATGAKPRLLPVGGNGADQVFQVNSLMDYAKFRAALPATPGRILIVGGGLVGCEFANDLAGAGFSVEVVDLQNYCLPELLPEPVARILEGALSQLGVKFYFNRRVVQIHKSDKTFKVITESGESLASDIILSATGITPDLNLAQAAGLKTHKGIQVDRYCRTNDDSIFALGDCAEVDGHLLYFVMPLMACARALARTLSGTETQVHYPAMPVVIKTPACPLVISPPVNSSQGTWQTEASGLNSRALFHDAQGRLLGFVLSGDWVKEKQKLALQVPAWLN